MKPGTVVIEMSSGVPLGHAALAERVDGARQPYDRRAGLRRRAAGEDRRTRDHGRRRCRDHRPGDAGAVGDGHLGAAHRRGRLRPGDEGAEQSGQRRRLPDRHRGAADRPALRPGSGGDGGRAECLDRHEQLDAEEVQAVRAVAQFDAGFTMGLLVKDLSIALQVGRETDTPTPFRRCAGRCGRPRSPRSGPGHNHTASAQLSEKMAGEILGGKQMTRNSPRSDLGSLRHPLRPARPAGAVQLPAAGRRPARRHAARLLRLAAAEREGHEIVVDTGFDAACAEKRGRTLHRSVGRQPARHRIATPARSRDVVITHLHYDHAGSIDLFPSATIHIQDREMAFATGRHMCTGCIRVPFEADHVVAMVRAPVRRQGAVP